MPFKRTLALAPVLLIACSAPGTSSAPDGREMEVSYLTTPGQEGLNLPFSEAVRIGDMLILSGQGGVLPAPLPPVAGGM